MPNMDLGLQGAYGVAGLQGSLDDLVKRAFVEQEAKKRAEQEDARIALEGERNRQSAQWQNASLASLEEQRAATRELQSEQGAEHLASTLTPGQKLDAGGAGVLRTGKLGSLIQHTDATLGSRNITSTGGALTSTANPGQPESDRFTGTATQQAAERQRKMLEQFANNPNLSDEARLALQYEQATGKNPPGELVKQPKPTSKPVMRVNPRTGHLEQIGDAPADSHFVTEPTTAPGAGDARMDRSYQFSVGSLDKLRKPFDDAANRLQRLHETLAQGTPQADALVAPELLTVMAGGQGSGLRMNEAEIARIIGGRSQWQSLQAAAQRWSLDPKTANSITPEQRKQIHDLVGAVDSRYQKALNLLDGAGDALVNAPTPEEHRKILNQVKKSLTIINAGNASGGAAPTGGSGFRVVEIK